MNTNPNGNKRLNGMNLLLVEDDLNLSNDLSEAFKNEGANIKTVYTKDAALTELREHAKEYDLIILDIMLPIKEQEFERIQQLDKELTKVRDVLLKEDQLREDDHELKQELEKAYERRGSILDEMETLIDREAGLKLLEELSQLITIQKLPLILVLTAVGSRQAIERGMALLKDCGDWIVKPIALEVIIEKATDLCKRVQTTEGRKVDEEGNRNQQVD